ncbi:MAG: sigma-70 family RNA polymerase sigma factor [Acidobacteriota bacterium]|nr:sigma-70 family RNA polymerase sigma factor [Acidobacteriota bacterium]
MDFYIFDGEYIRRLRDGDRVTVDHYYKYFNFFLKQRLSGRVPVDAIQDIIGEVHYRVWKYLHSGKEIREPERFGAFVFRFCDNIVHERSREHQTEQLQDVHPKPGPDPLDEAITAEEKAHILDVLDSLEPADANLLKEVLLDERDKDEICKELRVTRDYLRVLIHRAIKKFREAYKKKKDDS